MWEQPRAFAIKEVRWVEKYCEIWNTPQVIIVVSVERRTKSPFSPLLLSHEVLTPSTCPETTGCVLVNFSPSRLPLGFILTKFHVDYKNRGWEVGNRNIWSDLPQNVFLPGVTCSEYYCEPEWQLSVPLKLTMPIIRCTNYMWYILIIYSIYMLITYPI